MKIKIKKTLKEMYAGGIPAGAGTAYTGPSLGASYTGEVSPHILSVGKFIEKVIKFSKMIERENPSLSIRMQELGAELEKWETQRKLAKQISRPIQDETPTAEPYDGLKYARLEEAFTKIIKEEIQTVLGEKKKKGMLEQPDFKSKVAWVKKNKPKIKDPEAYVAATLRKTGELKEAAKDYVWGVKGIHRIGNKFGGWVPVKRKKSKKKKLSEQVNPRFATCMKLGTLSREKCLKWAGGEGKAAAARAARDPFQNAWPEAESIECDWRGSQTNANTLCASSLVSWQKRGNKLAYLDPTTARCHGVGRGERGKCQAGKKSQETAV